MGVRYERFEKLRDLYLEHGGNIPERLRAALAKLIHMAGYLADVDREAARIYEEYQELMEIGLIRV